MDYKDTLSFLFSQLPAYEKQGASSYKPGLANSIALDDFCGHPHRSYPCIHVAGTNGKGSVSHSLASILQEQGYKVGLYTSPHLLDFSERIRVNGVPIETSAVIEFTLRVRSLAESLRCSFFELTSAMAFDYFAQQKVDIAVIEVGLGGRLDSTNIIKPILSVITNISLDHTELLGTTLAEIAGEKAGIIKQQTPVVIGETNSETYPVFIQKAEACAAPIVFADVEYSAIITDQNIQSQIVELTSSNSKIQLQLDLQGSYQFHNVKTSYAAIQQLNRIGYTIEEQALKRGFANVVKNTGLKGRWQVLQKNPLVLCDTAHNEAGIREVVAQLKKTTADQLHVVWSNVKEKDLGKIVSLLPKNAHYYLAQLQMPRAMQLSDIEHFFEDTNLKFSSFLSLAEAVSTAKAAAKTQDIVFIGGSTFTVAEILPLFS